MKLRIRSIERAFGMAAATLVLSTACATRPIVPHSDQVSGQEAATASMKDLGLEKDLDLPSLIRLAEAKQSAGDPRSALALAGLAVEKAQTSRQETSLVVAEMISGRALILLEQFEAADARFEKAIAHAQATSLPEFEVHARLGAGDAARAGGARKETRWTGQYQRALEITDASTRPLLAGQTAAHVLRAYARQLEAIPEDARPSDEALKDFASLMQTSVQRLESIRESSDRAALQLHAARSLLVALPALDSTTQVVKTALELLGAGLAHAEKVPDDALASEFLGEQGRLAQFEGRLSEAIERTDDALLRSQRAGTESNQIRWHRQAGHLRGALGDGNAAVEHYGQAVELLQTHRHALTQNLDEATSQARTRKELRAVYLDYVELLLKRAEESLDRSSGQSDLLRARDTLERFKAAELRDYFDDECVDRYRDRVESVDAIDSRTLVLYPIALPDRLVLLVSGENGIEQHTVPISEDALREKVSELRQRLEHRTTRRYRRPARELYDLLIAPLEDLLTRDQVDTLVFVPDGILRTIPLAALYDGSQFLIERFAIATTPGIELTNPKPLAQVDRKALLGGLSLPREGFGALPEVVQELAEIEARVGGQVLLDETFGRERLVSELDEHDFDLVHLATHASFDSESSTGFLVTYDGRLGLDAFADALTGSRYREKSIELLVLSACETALGDERAGLGLSGIAIKAGAKSAIGSLWVVNDEAASELFKHFYDALGVPGTSRAAALRKAQRSLIEEGPFGHPAYWSTFLLLNNWL